MNPPGRIPWRRPRQMIMFSATMPPFIMKTLKNYMPAHVMVDTVGNDNNRTSTGYRYDFGQRPLCTRS